MNDTDAEPTPFLASPVLSATGLIKTYGGRAVVNGVTVEMQGGEIVGLLGPNGAGKTTTLRMLYTLMRPDTGRVLVDGIDAAADPLAVRKSLGVLPDARGLYKNLTARENIDYFARLQDMAADESARRRDELIKVLEMEDFADRRTEGFSQGQRVKTAIARALVHNPKNVLLDEPTNGLDIMATRRMRQFMSDLRTEGRCVLFSSHIMQEVAQLCDRIVVIAKGRVVADESPEALRQHTGESNLEDAFVKIIGSGEGLAA
jgi:sodium transport system ATP-binding protein